MAVAPQNDFLVWAGGSNANVLTQAQYATLPNETSGVVAGKASAQQANKTWRQASIMSSMIAKFIVDAINQPVIDDGTVQVIENNFVAAIRSIFVIPNTGVAPGTYGPTMALAVQADGRITHLNNAGLNSTGVTPGTYVGTTVTVGFDGRITGIVGVPYGQIAGNNVWTGVNNFLGSPGGTVVRFVDGSGANIELAGNGSTTPNKFIRAVNGTMSFVNSAYSAEIAHWDDAGNSSIPGNYSANSVTANSIQSNGNINANGTFTGGAVSVGTISSNGGNITANGARLRASLGAFGSGDVNAGVILNDYSAGLGSPGWMRLPNGLIIQWGVAVSSTGNGDVFNFPLAFPSACWVVVGADDGAGLPTNGAAAFNNGQFRQWAGHADNAGTSVTYLGGIGIEWIAIGV